MMRRSSAVSSAHLAALCAPSCLVLGSWYWSSQCAPMANQVPRRAYLRSPAPPNLNCFCLVRKARHASLMMWALEYDPDIFSTYEETGAATSKIEGFKPKGKSIRQFGRYERENMKNRAHEDDGPVPISVFLVASVLKENSPKLLQEARGIDDVIRILNNVNGNLDAKRACVVALKLHRKYLKKLQGKRT